MKLFVKKRNPKSSKPTDRIRPANTKLKNEFIAMIGEFVGTVMFLFMAFCGTNIAYVFGQPAGGPFSPDPTIYVALSFGFSLLVNAWVFYRISGSLFNPAISLAMLLVGQINAMRAVLATIAQILGGMVAAAMADALLPGKLLVDTKIGEDISTSRALFLEMFMTAELVLTVLMLAAEKHKGTYLAPVGIGLSLFVIMLVGTPYTGASVNPARSFGPAVVEHYFPIYHWIYWLGPCLGAFLASGFYKFVKWARYEEANPGQQDAGNEAPDSGDAATLRHGSSVEGDGRHFKPENSDMV